MATFDTHKNLASSLVATAPSPAASGTSLVVTAGEGAQFSAVPFNAIIYPTGARPTTANAEFVRVTNIATDTLTIVRAQESSVARTVILGDVISESITALTIQNIETAFNGIVQGRLTLTTAVPVTTADVTGATTVYFTPYGGNHIALYSGSAWLLHSFSEISLALGTITNDLPYDVFIYNNAGTLTLEFLAWTSKTARATALVLQDGVLCKTGVLTRRYLGTFHTTATTTTEDSLAKRLLWNYYNRVPRTLRRLETTNTWAYTTNIWRQANAAVANQVAVVVGWAEVPIDISVMGGATNTNASVAVAVNVVEDASGNPVFQYIASFQPDSAAAGDWLTPQARLFKYPVVGYHFYAWTEYSAATGTTTWTGDNGGADVGPCCGLTGWIDG